MIRVVDASAMIDALLPTPQQDAALSALRGHELYAPSILDLEVASALHRLERTERVDAGVCEDALIDLAAAPVRRLPVDRLVADAWRLRSAVRISDAFYVAAAARVGGELLTSDARLTRAPRLGVPVVLLG